MDLERYRVFTAQKFMAMTTGERQRTKPTMMFSREYLALALALASEKVIIYDAQEDLAWHCGDLVTKAGWYDGSGQLVNP